MASNETVSRGLILVLVATVLAAGGVAAGPFGVPVNAQDWSKLIPTACP